MEKQTKVKSKKKSDMPRSIGKQSGESVESVRKKKKKVTLGRICRKEGCKPGMKQWGGDGWWEWWVAGTDGRSAYHMKTGATLAVAYSWIFHRRLSVQDLERSIFCVRNERYRSQSTLSNSKLARILNFLFLSKIREIFSVILTLCLILNPHVRASLQKLHRDRSVPGILK